MLNYLKSVLGDMQQQQQPAQSEDVSNEAILEYAGLFQELDDLTVGAKPDIDGGRTPFHIDVEDDIELESLEINMTDGRVTDIPADATVTEAYEEMSHKYSQMKTYNDFVTESYSAVSRMPRESDERYNARRQAYVSSQWNAYQEYVSNNGLFGHTTTPLDSAKVSDFVTLEFAQGFTTRIPVKWEIDRSKNVTKKQLDTLEFLKRIGSDQMEMITECALNTIAYANRRSNISLDDATPVGIAIPTKPADMYTAVIEFDTNFTGKTQLIQIQIPVNDATIQESADMIASATEVYYAESYGFTPVRKRDYAVIKEKMARPSRFGNRFVQEAIDFGGGGDPPAPMEDTVPPAAEQPAEGGGDAGVDTTQADAGAPAEEPAPDVTVPANVNDVSDQIAEKVADQTEAQAQPDDLDMNVDLGDGADMTVDLENPEAPVDPNAVDAELDALDDAGAEDAGVDGTDVALPDNLDDMTIDELIAQGSEKLKGMTLAQLKEFLNSPDGTTPQDVQEAFFMMESLFTRKGNVKKRIETALKDFTKGLSKIISGIEGDWDRREFTKFWHEVKSGSSLSGGFDDEGDFYMGSTKTTNGEYFSERVEQLMHYIKVAIKKKRARDAFTFQERDRLQAYLNQLKDFHKKGDTAASSIRSNDVSLDEILEDAKALVETSKEVQTIVGEKRFTESYVFEAALITKKNIRGMLTEHIKSTLGILNKTDVSFKQLVEDFKKEGKELNRVLGKAAKMKKLFTMEQRNEIAKLNALLLDLQSSMRLNAMSTEYSASIKKMIADFAKQCKVVNATINGGTVVQEASATTKRRATSNIKNALMGGLLGLFVHAISGNPITVLGLLTWQGVGVFGNAAINHWACSKEEAKVAREVLNQIYEVSNQLTRDDKSPAALKTLKKNLRDLSTEARYLSHAKDTFFDGSKRGHAVDLSHQADYLADRIKDSAVEPIPEKTMSDFIYAMSQVVQDITGKSLEELKKEAGTKGFQEACCQNPDTVKEADNSHGIENEEGPYTGPIENAEGPYRGIENDEIGPYKSTTWDTPGEFKEEDTMSYSDNNGDSSTDTSDGADVGGVDFESEGVQREERVRAAKAKHALVDTGMSSADAKQLDRDLRKSTKTKGSYDRTYGMGTSRIGRERIEAQERATTPKYVYTSAI